MIKFDKIKIITSLHNISQIDENYFITTSRDGEVLYYKYQQERPYSLIILVNLCHNELAVEFTGKILREQYPLLINQHTISNCFDNINAMGICHLNTDAIMKDAEVVKCDVTTDIGCDISAVTSTVKQNLSNYSKWAIKSYNRGIVIEKTASTPRHKKRLAIYPKGKELQKASNGEFMGILKNRDEVMRHFTDKLRFELNINTKEQVRQLLNIPDNSLQCVLHSQANPILSVIEEAVKYTPQRQYRPNLRDYERELMLRECEFDMARVEAKVRALSSKNTSISRLMQPYKELNQRLSLSNVKNINIRQLVSNSCIL